MYRISLSKDDLEASIAPPVDTEVHTYSLCVCVCPYIDQRAPNAGKNKSFLMFCLGLLPLYMELLTVYVLKQKCFSMQSIHLHRLVSLVILHANLFIITIIIIIIIVKVKAFGVVICCC